MNNPITDLASLKVGTVQTVSTKEITAELEYDTPYTTALNTGNIINFPRINSYILIPNEKGALVGIVTWLGIKKDNYSPPAHHTKNYDFVNLPTAKRIIIITPLGILKHQTDKTENSNSKYTIERGISAFPSVGDDVNLPTNEQLKGVVESSGNDRRVLIGTSPIASDVEVRVDPDKIFGRHLAVLGNTGSGKSCTVAGLIRWSLGDAKNESEKQVGDKDTAKGKDKKQKGTKEVDKGESKNKVNANFIILDVNGEYTKAFKEDTKVLAAYTDNTKIKQLQVPMWLWNNEEWCFFSQASSGVQEPALLGALETVRKKKKYKKKDIIDALKLEKSKLKGIYVGHIDTLINRIESLYKDKDFLNIINDSGTDNDWLYKYTQSNNESNITIIDLSLISDTILHTIVSVIARIIFEKHQEYKKEKKSLYQTILVLEEAHRFIGNEYRKEDEFNLNKACVRSFNRIAREGRKFGLSLVISSQRPHEISGTVLSQCNTFLLHRIVNSYDQDFVKKLVPDSLGMFMDELPALPSQQALLLGWASPIPKLVNIRDLDAEYRPDSEDPKVWEYWLGSKNKESTKN